MTSKHHINKKGPKCFHCGKFGHLKHNCRLLGEDSKERVKRDYPKKKGFFIAAVYVDDIILASKSSTRIQEFIKSISESFDIKDMGKLHYFLGVKIAYPGSGKIWIRQPAYTAEVLKRFQMENSKPTATAIDNGAKLTKVTETASYSIKNCFSRQLEVYYIFQQEQDLILPMLSVM